MDFQEFFFASNFNLNELDGFYKEISSNFRPKIITKDLLFSFCQVPDSPLQEAKRIH